MRNEFLFSSWKERKTKNRRRWLALSVSFFTHLLLFGLVIIINPSLRLELSPLRSERTVLLSPRLHLPSLEINSLLNPQAGAPSIATSPPPAVLNANRPEQGPGQLKSESASPTAAGQTLPTALKHLTASFNLNVRNTTKSAQSSPQTPPVYNFSLIPKDIPEEIPWLKQAHYQPGRSEPDLRIISKFMSSAGESPLPRAALLQAITLPPSAPPYDPALLSPWANLVVTHIQKKWIEFIPRQLSNKRPAQISLEVDRQGNLLSLKVSQSSGDSLLDESLVRAIRVSQPFPPLPSVFPAEKIQVKLIFQANEK
ncbi:TonB C-terminal domain-containing protein [Candidatus Aminicenantes bacterium AC-334-K16]|jgi:TonB family protein|nr:TonB C-terminal domain-containing protein [Candidatus Aminicenantes bacterium AC-334-K16]